MRASVAYRLCISVGIALIVALAWAAFLQGSGARNAPASESAGGSHSDASNLSVAGGASEHSALTDLLPSADSLALEPSALEREEAVTHALEDLLTRSPAEAIAWVGQVSDPARREQMIGLMARFWAGKDPEAALEWAQSLEGAERESTIRAALGGMANQPAAAVPLAVELLLREPALAAERGSTFLQDLASAGQFPATVVFAAQAPEEFRADWMHAAFARWANARPEAAASFLAEVREPELRAAAFESVVKGWAQLRPAGLADYATALPTGPERTFALDEAARSWCLQDPTNMAGWLSRVGSTPEFDKSKSILVNQTDSLNRDPKVAMQWAESIGDPDLRLGSVAHVLRELAAQDRSAAESYIQNAFWFNPEQREDLRQSLGASP